MSELKNMKAEIEKKLEKGDILTAKRIIGDYEKVCNDNLNLYIYKGIAEVYSNELKKAEDIFRKGLKKYPFNFDLNYNFAIVLDIQSKYMEAAKYYIISSKLCSESMQEIVKSNFDTLINKISLDESLSNSEKQELVNLINQNMNGYLEMLNANNMKFPTKNSNESYIGNYLKKDYYVAKYDHYGTEKDDVDFPVNILSLNGIEMYQTINECNCFINDYDNAVILPIASKKKQWSIDIDGAEIRNSLNRRYYYYKLDKGSKVKFDSDAVVAKPIKLTKNEDNKDLVLNIFIDGLAQCILDEFGIENVMPRTYKYFSKGTICNNVYTVAEWTLPSVASIFTGKYIGNHRLYHPRYDYELNSEVILPEIFKQKGYFTSKIDGNSRTNPSYGYYRGIDRTIYKASSRWMGIEEITNEIIESMESFKDTNQFIWSCVFNLHDIADGYELNLNAQVNTKCKNRKFVQAAKDKSVNQSYDEDKKARYVAQLKRIDLYLGLIYSYILENYNEDKILVSLISDHGQSYLIPTGKPLLSKERTKVPMMFRGGNVDCGVCNELISTVDYLKILNSVCNDDIVINNIDGNLPVYFGGEKEREFVYTESIYPGKTYKACITFNEYTANLETTSNVDNDGRIELDGYKLDIYDNNGEKVIDSDIENKCINIIKEHTKNIIR